MKDSLYYELSDFYWLYSSNKNYEEESQFLSYLINKHNSNAKKILDVGCGQGDHCFFLKKFGFEVFGVDKSNYQINFAKKKFKEINFSSGDFLETSFSDRFDSIIMVWNTLLYFSPPSNLSGLFKKVKSLLNEEGIFIFDFKSFPLYISNNEFKSNLERTYEKKGYVMELKTNNVIQEDVVLESTDSIIKKDNKIIVYNKNNSIALNMLSLELVLSYLKSADLDVLEILDINSLNKNNPSLLVDEKTRGYLVVVKNSK